MSTHKNIDLICVVVLVITLLLTVLFMNGEALGLQLRIDEDAQAHSDDSYFTASDLDGDWDASTATVIALEGDTAKITGSNAYTDAGSVFITNSGHYSVSGTLSDGSLVVDANVNSKVWILLDGVTITNSSDACIRVNEADKVFLTLSAGSVNTLSAGASLSDAALSNGTDGAIFAHDDLTINGSGSLTITTDYAHGIAANDDLVITGGTLRVNAVKDGIRANDSLRICNAAITVEAGDDGIVSDGAEDAAGSGWLYIASGTLTITSADDSIHTAGDVVIDGGTFRISSGDDAVHSDTAVYLNDSTMTVDSCREGVEAPIIEMAGGSVEIHASDDGFNACGDGACLRISGGSLTILNENGRDADGLDSNGSLYITGGTIRISLSGTGSNSAIDFASETGGVCEISGGTVIACGSYAMAERFDSSSYQCSFLYTTSSAIPAGSQLALKDPAGKELLSCTVPYSFTAVNISCPELQLGESYTIAIGDSEETITLGESSAVFGDVQGPMNGGMQGGMGRPGTPGQKPEGNDVPSGAPPEKPEGDPFSGEVPPEKPEGDPFSGEVSPEKPDGGFDGQPGDMQEPPDGMGEPPADRSDMGEPPAETAPSAPAETSETQEPNTNASQTWLWLGISGCVLILGLVSAKLYRK